MQSAEEVLEQARHLPAAERHRLVELLEEELNARALLTA
jgi:hypothetical protein